MPETSIIRPPMAFGARRSVHADLHNCQIFQNRHNGRQERGYGSARDVPGDRMKGSRPTAALVLAGSCLAATLAASAQQRIKVGVDLVHFSVVVTDKQGSPITGLKQEDFEVVEEGTPQTISYFKEGDPEDGESLGDALPLHLGLALDASGSMERDIHDIRTAIIKFLNANRAAIDFTLIDFDTEIRVTRYGADEMERLIERIRRRKPEGWTALYDAVGVYLNGAGPQDGQKILLLYTDGGDTRSELTFSDLLDLLKSSDVTLYAIGYMENQPSSARSQQQSQLQRMAAITGGQVFLPSSIKELDKIYDKIQREIAARYSIGFTSTNTRKDGVWRKVDIKLKRPDLKSAKLRTRTGYFAPYREGGQ
jgi:Ca-activated chloride channel family protein